MTIGEGQTSRARPSSPWSMGRGNEMKRVKRKRIRRMKRGRERKAMRKIGEGEENEWREEEEAG